MNQRVATHIELRPNRGGSVRAYIEGTRIRVQDIFVQAEMHGRAPAEIQEALPQLSLGQIHAALSYSFDHRDEVLREIREDETYVEQLKAASGPNLLQRHRPRATGS